MAETTVRQWEYKTLRPSRNATKKEATDPQTALNDYGEDGWEFAGTIDYSGGGTKFVVFKRPVETDAARTDSDSSETDADTGEENATTAEEDPP